MAFKNEEDLKEYLENLGIEYRFGCFSEKNPEVCHLLGEYLDVIKSDFHKAAKIFKSNCDDFNYGRSCQAYGNCLAFGKGEEKNLESAFKYYTKACDQDMDLACFNAGLLAIKGKSENRQRDYTKGLALMEKSCNLKLMNGCFYLSGIYIRGTPDKVIEKDMKKAFTYAVQACELGNMYACSNVSVMYKKGDGVDQDEKMSNKYKDKAEKLRAELSIHKNEAGEVYTM